MGYKIEQKIGKHKYIYEVESYWDKEKKQARQKRKYIGKKDEKSGEIIPAKSRKVEIVQEYGTTYVLEKIAEEIGLKKVLKEVYPREYEEILELAYYQIAEGEALYLFEEWREEQYIENREKLTTNKRVEKVLEKVGNNEKAKLEFGEKWIKHLGETATIVYDITSISSYSQQIEIVEWGYNRDGEKLPQINLGIIYSQTHRLPLYYQVYPGSINDVTTLKNILKYLNFFELKEALFVLDRGFYSLSNLEAMLKLPINFVIPLPTHTKLFTQILASHSSYLNDPSKAIIVGDQLLFSSSQPIDIAGFTLQAHIYFNPQQACFSQERFLKKLLELEEISKTQSFSTIDLAREFLSNHLPNALDFFSLSLVDNSVRISRDNSAIAAFVSSLGFTVLLSTDCSSDSKSLLSLYRSRDLIEKNFDFFKNSLDGSRLRVHSSSSLDSRLFLKFISLILFQALLNLLLSSGLDKSFSIPLLLAQLKKLKRLSFSDGSFYFSELSKRLKNIFLKLSIPLPST